MQDFANNHPEAAVIIVLIISVATTSLARSAIFLPFNRWMRHRNIVARGWPPEHLDADGDFKITGTQSEELPHGEED